MTSTTQSVRTAIRKVSETVYAFAYRATDQSNLTGNAWNKINLNAVVNDAGKNFSITEYKFTAPVTGLYSIIASIEYTSVTADKRYMTAIYKNAAAIRSVSAQASLVANVTVECSADVYLIKDDYIELYGQPECGVGTDTTDVESGTTSTCLIIRLITKEGARQ